MNDVIIMVSSVSNNYNITYKSSGRTIRTQKLDVCVQV